MFLAQREVARSQCLHLVVPGQSRLLAVIRLVELGVFRVVIKSSLFWGSCDIASTTFQNLHALVEYLSLVLRKNLFGIEPRPHNQYVPKDKHSDSYPAQDSTRKRNYAVTIRFLSFM